MSLDGYVAPAKGAPDHRSLPEDPALKRTKLDWLDEVGTHAMGRVTHEEMATHWPGSTDDYATPNELPKVVLQNPGGHRVEQLTRGAVTWPRRSPHCAKSPVATSPRGTARARAGALASRSRR
jgi:hypothetical protein